MHGAEKARVSISWEGGQGQMIKTTVDLKPRSVAVTEGPERAPHRAMLRATGLTDEDLRRPLIGVASSWNEVTPCNLHLNALARYVKEGVRAAGGTPIEFTTIAVSDAIAMGHEGMKASLVSREVIADSVELMVLAEAFDGLVAIAGCDKSLPGMMLAIARLNIPAVFLYGGTILPGRFQGRDVTIVDVFEAVGAHAEGLLSADELHQLECVACPRPTRWRPAWRLWGCRCPGARRSPPSTRAGSRSAGRREKRSCACSETASALGTS